MTKCTACGLEMELDPEMVKELKREARGAMPPMRHDVCPGDAPEMKAYTVEVMVRAGAPSPPDTADESVLTWMSETVLSPTLVGATDALARGLGQKWLAVVEQFHVIESVE